MPFKFQHLFLAFLIFQARILGKPQKNSSKLMSDFKFNNSNSDSDAEEIEDWESNNYYYDDNNYDADYQEHDQDEGHRHLVTREAVYDSRKYVNSCDKSVRMKKNKKIRIISAFRGTKQYFSDTTCDWNFLGSSECSPKISCSTIDLRTTGTCDEDYLLIFDGVSGGLKLCGENSDLNKAKKSKEGYDLYVIFKSGESTNFKRLYKGIECVVSCDTAGDAEPLPEKTDMFKRETGCECGISEKTKKISRIIGGEDADNFEFPWLVGIVPAKKRIVYCGGSLINSKYILTASHCFAVKDSTNKTIKVSTSEVMVHMHDQHKTDAAENSVRVKIQRVICHPFYGHDIEYDNDVCILELATPVDIVSHRPICLPLFSMDWSPLNGTNVTVSGWGKLIDQPRAPGSPILQKVTVPMLNKTVCEQSYKDENITSQMMCAGYPQGTMDACQGDSGGPLMKELSDTATQTKREQIGVVSWGYGCANPDLPGMYANVAVLLPWIRRTAMSGTWCVEGARTPAPPPPPPLAPP